MVGRQIIIKFSNVIVFSKDFFLKKIQKWKEEMFCNFQVSIVENASNGTIFYLIVYILLYQT